MVNERGHIILGPQPEGADQSQRFALIQGHRVVEIPHEDLWEYASPDRMTVTLEPSIEDEQEGEH